MSVQTRSLKPTVSVLMPVFNAGPYLAQAIESVLRQTRPDWELLIGDDGSTDGSAQVIETYRRADSRVRVLSRANTGLVVMLNELAGVARGEFFARMDSDDVCGPGRFERQVEAMQADESLVCLGGAIELIDGDGVTLLRPEPLTGDAAVQSSALSGLVPISHPACTMRADAFRQIGGYRHRYFPAEDLDLFLRLGEVGTLDNVPELVLRYRVHAASVSVTKRDHQLSMLRTVCEQAWKRRGVSGVEFLAGREPPEAAGLSESMRSILRNPTAASLAGGSAGLAVKG